MINVDVLLIFPRIDFTGVKKSLVALRNEGHNRRCPPEQWELC